MLFAFVYAMFSLILGQFRIAERELGHPPADSPESSDSDESPVDTFYSEIAAMEHAMGLLPHNSDEVSSRCVECRRAKSGD